MTSPVIVQMTRVSMNGPSMATMPSRTGSSVLAAAWAMGAEPWPDSLENSPRFTPQVSMKMKPPPAKPPTCAAGWKAAETIRPMAGSTSEACRSRTTRLAPT